MINNNFKHKNSRYLVVPCTIPDSCVFLCQQIDAFLEPNQTPRYFYLIEGWPYTELQGQSQKPEIQILNGIYPASAPTNAPPPGHHMHEMALLEITTQVY